MPIGAPIGAPTGAPAPELPGAAVLVHGLAEAAAAVAAAPAPGLTLLSPPGAAGTGGVGWFLALAAQAAAARPGLPCAALVDCGDAAGHALAALRAGAGWLLLDPATPALPALRAAAVGHGATVLTARPDALDLGRLDLRRPAARARLAAWLAVGRAANAPAAGIAVSRRDSERTLG